MGEDLKARYVIHAVGPVYNDGVSGESSLLAKAYRNSSRLVVENDLCSVAFLRFRPAPYRYPLRDAASIALETIVEFLKT